LLSWLKVALTCGEDDRFQARLGICLVKNDAAAVPTSVLGVVESFVGAREERACDFAGCGLGEADADGKGHPGVRYRELAHRLLDAGRDNVGVGTGGAGKDEEEFVATEAAEEVVGAQTAGDGGDDVAQGSVTGCMPGLVIDRLEVVDVDEGDRQVLAAALGALEFGVELLLDAATVEDAAEEIPFRLVLDQGEEIAAEHEEEGQADEEGEGDAEEDGDGLKEDPLSLIGRDSKHHQEDDAVQGEERITCHEEGEDLQEYSVCSLTEDLERDNAADEEETESDDPGKDGGVSVRLDKVGGEDGGDGD
jgi:hypothetical protein